MNILNTNGYVINSGLLLPTISLIRSNPLHEPENEKNVQVFTSQVLSYRDVNLGPVPVEEGLIGLDETLTGAREIDRILTGVDKDGYPTYVYRVTFK